MVLTLAAVTLSITGIILILLFVVAILLLAIRFVILHFLQRSVSGWVPDLAVLLMFCALFGWWRGW